VEQPDLKDDETARATLDLRGLKCPLPALFARRALRAAKPGDTISVLTDDPMAPIDVPHMCRQEAFETLDIARNGDEARITLKRPE
jgi:tRNA 2-thiouridine synthesizing protein A